MSRAVPHVVRVIEAPGQPQRVYGCDSKAEALREGDRIALSSFVGASVQVYRGTPDDVCFTDRDPVKVWS